MGENREVRVIVPKEDLILTQGAAAVLLQIVLKAAAAQAAQPGEG